MAETRLEGSGGWISAEITDEQAKQSKLVPNIDKHFLAPLGRLDTSTMSGYHCKRCSAEFEGPVKIRVEERPNEAVADGLVLAERGQYVCQKCDSTIGEYRVFEKAG